MSRVCDQTNQKLSFTVPEFGPGYSVKFIDFKSKGAEPPFKSTYFEVLPGCATPIDQHKVEECWIVLKGEGVLKYDDEEVKLTEQDVVHFAPHRKHQVRNDSSGPLLICSIYW